MARDTLIVDPPRAGAATRSTWLPWSIAGLSFVLYAVSVALYLLTRSVQTTTGGNTDAWGPSIGLAQLLVFLPFLVFPLVGALIACRHPGNPIGWICLVVGILWMFVTMSSF